jgi:hypothetical protein
MARFFIEVPHEPDLTACTQAVENLLNYGSHFVVNTDWGCMDGEHKAWITIEADNKEEARAILPPGYRSRAKIVQLNKFTMEDIDEILKLHGKE